MIQDVKYKCIVVEDEALIRRNLVKKVNELNIGFSVIGEVMDGESAIKLVDEEIPHLVISDIQMPVKTGIDLIKYIYYEYPSIKVILVSGYNDFEYARQAIKYGVKEYLIKPVSTEDLQSSLIKIKMLLDSEMNELSSLSEQAISSEELVQMIEMYIKNNYQKDLSIPEIAKSLHFSTDHLSRVYKKATGQSPLKYLINLRIKAAKQFLVSRPDMSIKAVGEIVGYVDQYYFSRIFKNCTGCYPSEYRTMKIKSK